MDTNKYKSRSINVEHINDATRLGMTLNAYIDHLKESVKELSLQIRSTEQENTLERLKATEGAIASMAEALKHQRYMTDSQSRKIDDQNRTNAQNAEMLEKLLNAFSAKLAFIEALEKEITQ